MDCAEFRRQYREQEVGRHYSGPLHLAFTLTAGGAVILLAVTRLDAVVTTDWLAIPLTFLYANLAEYWGHRGPMHHPTRGLKLVYRRHAGQHHRFFTQGQMAFEGSRDYKAVLFPPVLIIFFLAVFAVPYWLLMNWLWSANAAWLGVATAAAYFLNYELLHFAYHCPEQSLIGRLPGLAVLRRLHHGHHDPRQMTRCNFNITYPIGDWLFGTLRRGC